MATGIIGALAGAGTISYTPTSPAKVSVSYSGQSGCSINGARVIPGANSITTSVTVWVGPGQTLTVVLSDTSTSAGSAIVSCVEGN